MKNKQNAEGFYLILSLKCCILIAMFAREDCYVCCCCGGCWGVHCARTGHGNRRWSSCAIFIQKIRPVGWILRRPSQRLIDLYCRFSSTLMGEHDTVENTVSLQARDREKGVIRGDTVLPVYGEVGDKIILSVLGRETFPVVGRTEATNRCRPADKGTFNSPAKPL